jgi:hypothetical protein
MDPQTTVASGTHLRHEAAHKWLAWTAAVLPIIACCALISAKLALLWRINVNWDEFFFLSHVYELTGGRLTLLFQGAYTHLFRWLTWLDGNEVDQILAARLVMFGLLALTSFLLWRLARVWVSHETAALAPLCYLAMSPVLKHGGSFRYDSLMVPLTVLTLLLLAKRKTQRHGVVLAAVSLGVSAAISVKAILLAPAIGVLMLLTSLDDKPFPWRKLATDVLVFGATAALTLVVLMGLHKLSVTVPVQGSSQLAAETVNKVLLDVPFFPQAGSFYATRYTDNFAWLLLFAGALAALLQRRFRPAFACSLTLLPILFYRNAFPYYYVVMLAPACVLAAVAADTVREFLVRRAQATGAYVMLSVIAAALLAHGATQVADLRHNDQLGQRMVVNAVHSIFPQPVPYLDHSGMIASFPKVNFFMSTWGIQTYRQNGRAFMAEALKNHAPPLLLANRPVLDPNAGAFKRLLPEDQELIERFYLPYWGPIRVAGAAFTISDGAATAIELPFSGSYRLETSEPVLVDGTVRGNGDVVTVGHTTVQLRSASTTSAGIQGRFIIASAQPPPPGDMPSFPLYTGL